MTLIPGDNAFLLQDFNSACGTVVSIDNETQVAVLKNVFDLFGPKPGFFLAPLAHLKPWPHAPRMLGTADLTAALRAANTAIAAC